jgi:hypothetical protein
MEKFSGFRDPLTGINPFLPPKRPAITVLTVLRALVNLPLYILYLLGLPTLHWIITMHRHGASPKGVVYVNNASPFDRYVLRHLFMIRVFTRLPTGLCAVFPEGCRTNNRGVLSYERPADCDSAIGLKYTPECIYMPGIETGLFAYLRWSLCFLGGRPAVEARCVSGHGLDKAARLPKLTFAKDKKPAFIEYYRTRPDGP